MYNAGFKIAAVKVYLHCGSIRQTSAILGIAVSTVWRWIQQSAVNRPIVVRQRRNSDVVAALRDFVHIHPCTTLKDMRQSILEALDLTVSRQLIASVLRSLGISRKRTRRRGVGKATEERTKTFLAEISKVGGYANVIAVDECGFDYKTLPLYGYSAKGTRVIVHTSNFRTRRSLIMGVNQNGYISAVRVDGGVKSAHFAIFIQGIQAPPGTVILMDNASIHNTHAVRDAISQKQFVMLFVPPYSPDFNPIENMFSMVKNAFRRDYEHEPIRTFGDSIAGILQSLDRRKIAHCFEHAQKIVTAALDST